MCRTIAKIWEFLTGGMNMGKHPDHSHDHHCDTPLKRLIRELHFHHHQLIELRRRNIEMTEVTDNLKAALADERTVIDGAVAFIEGTPALIGEAVRKALLDAGIDQAAIEAAVNEAIVEAKDQTDDLKAALVKGTGEQLPTP